MHHSGEGILMNKSLAVHYYKLSVDQGFVMMQWVYANCLLSGIGIEANTDVGSGYL
jgi:TPR repeat protein